MMGEPVHAVARCIKVLVPDSLHVALDALYQKALECARAMRELDNRNPTVHGGSINLLRQPFVPGARHERHRHMSPAITITSSSAENIARIQPSGGGEFGA